MADSDIFVSNDIELDVDFGEIFVIDQGVVTKVVAKKYDPTHTYTVGEYVIHLEKLYKCVTAIEEPEEFDSNKWTQVLLADEVQVLNATMPNKADKSDTYTKAEINTALGDKADKATTYTKTEVDTSLSGKADKSDTYTKQEVTDALTFKADKSDTYTKQDVNDALALKADKSDTYTKNDVNGYLDLKADKSDTYTKSEVDTAVGAKADSDDVYDKSETYSKTEVDNIISNLPAPMIFKGTLGTGGTITTLPTASSDNEGFTYKVITDGTYASQVAKAGDMFTSNGSEWIYIPSGDETFTDTWRGIKVNGTEKLGSAISSGEVDFINGTNTTVSFNSTGNKIKVDVDGYTQAQVDTKLSAKANSANVYTKTETDNKLALKANSADVYTKSAVDTALATKVNVGDTVGTAEELAESVKTVNQTPYLTRTPSNIGNRCLEMLVGGTVAFNQLVDYANITSETTNNVTFTNSNGVITIATNGTASGNVYKKICSPLPNVAGHKLLIIGSNKAVEGLSFYDDSATKQFNAVSTSTIISASGVNISYYCRIVSGATVNTKISPLVFDLTQMFGSTIADYIYTLESGTAGAGVAWFRNYFTADYYPYTANTLMSVKTSAKKIYDANNTLIETYDLSGPRLVHRRFVVVDLGTLTWVKDTTSLSVTVFRSTVMSDRKAASVSLICSKYQTITMGRNGLIDTNNAIASWNIIDSQIIAIRDDSLSSGTAEQFKTAMSGVYLVYELATPFDETVSNPELRGIPKLDANNNLYYDGDTCNDFTNPQTVVSGGKEEFVDGRSIEIPVGHYSQYYTETEGDKIKYLPELTGSKGKYVVEEENGEMKLTPLSSEGYKEVVLYDNTDETNLTIITLGNTITLSDSFMNYDEIIVTGVFWDNALTLGKRFTHIGECRISKGALQQALTNYDTGEYGQLDVLTQYVIPSYYCTYVFKVPTTTTFYIHQKNRSGWREDWLTISKIVGIKY